MSLEDDDRQSMESGFLYCILQTTNDLDNTNQSFLSFRSLSALVGLSTSGFPAKSTIFKVGRTVNPVVRRNTLQTGNPHKLEVQVQLYATRKLAFIEQLLLEKLRSDQSRFICMPGGSEWFALVGDTALTVVHTYMRQLVREHGE